jgi:hypothetical protein
MQTESILEGGDDNVIVAIESSISSSLDAAATGAAEAVAVVTVKLHYFSSVTAASPTPQPTILVTSQAMVSQVIVTFFCCLQNV